MKTAQLINGLNEIAPCGQDFPRRPQVHVALGFFDGVHRGHQAVIASARAEAEREGGFSLVMGFLNHPLSYICPHRAPELITPDREEKARLMADLGIDYIFLPEFGKNYAESSPRAFVEQLCTHVNIKTVSVGDDWRFGKDRAGDVDLLRTLGKEFGFRVIVIPSFCDATDTRISSSRIRDALRQGDMPRASELLGHPYALSGEVVHGRHLARELGFPTLNIPIIPITQPSHSKRVLPPLGVYAVRVYGASSLGIPEGSPGIANLGLRPTVEGDVPKGSEHASLLLEVHIFDHSADLYGRNLRVELLHFLRPERKFPSLDALKEQIAADVRAVRSLAFYHSSSLT